MKTVDDVNEGIEGDGEAAREEEGDGRDGEAPRGEERDGGEGGWDSGGGVMEKVTEIVVGDRTGKEDVE